MRILTNWNLYYNCAFLMILIITKQRNAMKSLFQQLQILVILLIGESLADECG